MSNLTRQEAFELEAAAILAAAYSAFPMMIDWKPESDGERYPTETGETREQIQSKTVRRLIASGHLYCEIGFSDGEWRGLGLTEKGLNALKSLPDAVPAQQPIGRRLAAAVGKSSIELIKRLNPALIGRAVLG